MKEMEQLKKHQRQQRILSLIRARPIATQEELRHFLELVGVPATQSSVSRDLEDLGIVKHNGRYVVMQTTRASAHGLLSLDLAGENLLVAHTEPGLASAVAVDIDGADIPEIVGTLAGEDTIFVAVNDRKAQRRVMKRIWGLFV